MFHCFDVNLFSIECIIRNKYLVSTHPIFELLKKVIHEHAWDCQILLKKQVTLNLFYFVLVYFNKFLGFSSIIGKQ